MPDALDLLQIASDERRHVQFTPDEAKWLLDRLAAATERADKAEAAIERVRKVRDGYKRAYSPTDEARLSGVIRDLKRALDGGDRG